jgi:crotonobetainyl-CoA:carnitine CoA-transferase CaiB-like acyl-CoA transferase
MASRTTREWQESLEARGVPASGVALPVEILDDEQPIANDMFHRFEHPTAGCRTPSSGHRSVSATAASRPCPPTAPFGSEARSILEWAGSSRMTSKRCSRAAQ